MELSDLFFCLPFIEIILLDKVQGPRDAVLYTDGLSLPYLSLLGEVKQQQQQQRQQQQPQSPSWCPVFLSIEVFVYFLI